MKDVQASRSWYFGFLSFFLNIASKANKPVLQMKKTNFEEEEEVSERYDAFLLNRFSK